MATLKDLLVSGPARVIGKITATSFVKNGATANNILLAGGGDVAQSSFASSGHEHSVSLVSGGTSTVNLAANTAYTLTVGGSSIVFKTPSDNNNNTVTTGKSGVVLGTTGVAVVQKDGTDSGTVALPSTIPSTWLGTSSTTAAAGNHTHSGYLTSHQTIKVDGVTGATTSHYGTCGTAAGTAAKVVSVTGTPTLEAGLRVIVKFTTTNTAASPTLNVNSLGAKSIYYRGSAITSSSNNIIQANRVYEFVYDGTNWQLVGDINTNSGGTVTSVGLTNATNGGLTVTGSPVTGSGSITVGHTNVLSSAQTTQAVYPIKIDKNGHISAYGTAVTIPTNTNQLTNGAGFTTNTGTVTSVGITDGGGLTITGSPVTTSGTITVGHTNTVDAGTNVGNNSTTTLSHGGTFTVPYFSYDTNGHITEASTKTLTLPGSGNTDNFGTVYVETAAGTRAKTATVPWTYTLKTGNIFVLYLKTTNTVTTSGSTYVTLNINSTGAKQVRINGAVPTTSNWTAGTYLCYYDGTYYQMYTNRDPFRDTLPPDAGTTASAVGTSSSGGSATTYSKSDHVHNITSATITAALGYTPSSTDSNDTLSGVAICSTAAGTAAKTANIPNFTLVNGQTILLWLKNSNTASSPTLNINSSGAKAVYIGGSAATTSNFTAGYWFCTYDSTQTPVRWTVEKVTNSNISNGAGYTTNTGTVTSVGLTNATNGGLTVTGSPVTGSGSITVGHTNVLSSAQTTQAVYPIKIDKNGHISSYGTAVTIPTLPSNIVNTITTTAGTHTAITSSTGNVSFNVPTNTSHLTNDSGFITSYVDENVKQTAVSTATANDYPILFTYEASPTSGNAYGAKYSPKAKISQSGDIILYSNSTGTAATPSLVFRRGGTSDTLVDYSIQNTGTLNFYSRTTGSWTERLQLTKEGNMTITGSDSTYGKVTANGFIKSGATSTNLLQAGGGDIALGSINISSFNNDAGYVTSDTDTTLSGVCFIDGANGAANLTASFPGFTLHSDQTIIIGKSLPGAQNNMTLNVNGTGAFPLYLQGSAVTASSDFHAGWYWGKYDGTKWNLDEFSVDGLYVGNSSTDIGNNSNLTNGNVHLNSYSNGTVRTSYAITGQNGVSVTTDNSGNLVISGSGGTGTDTNYYPTAMSWTNGTSNGPTATITMSGTSNISVGAIPAASGTTRSGIVTTGAQTFGGVKTFSSSPKLSTNKITTSGSYTQTFPNATGTIVNGTGTNNYIAKWNGTNSITSGPAFGSSTTTFLRNDGTWATPAGGNLTVSATPSESSVEGYKAGTVTINGVDVNFNVAPARAIQTSQPSYGNYSWSGVVRPFSEIDLSGENNYSFNSTENVHSAYFANIQIANGLNASQGVTLIPITTVYHLNTITNRYEAIPFLALPTREFENYFSGCWVNRFDLE